ncbi:protein STRICTOSIDINE SYNTHASE-LIKE 11-like [Camellia sinensis]|uniref:protein STRICTOSIDINE SYNTHASE-LIKE 11-like n=1 Tax=Camellia sinensis TaxID=4442 RepID=UPI0010360385|nr:protein STRICTOSIDINE SYNTHASE-LIKE 11-like [Camellia sinensis]
MEAKSSFAPIISTMLSLFIVCFSFPHIVLSNEFPSFFYRLQLPSATGPESLAFALKGEGPYTGVAGGRILKYGGPNIGFVEFATTSPHRTKELCDGTNDQNLESICGRPLGLGFNDMTGELYIVDPYFGLLAVGAGGGLATQLATGVKRMPFAFLDALDVDPVSKIVYFTDASAVFRLGNVAKIIQSGDTSARLLKYDPKTNQVTVLLTGLSGAIGVAVSKDGAVILVTELITSRIRRFWVKGPKANSAEILTYLPGNPDNIKRTILGEFWVAANIQNQQPMLPVGLRIDVFGNILESFSVGIKYNTTLISEVHEHDGKPVMARDSAEDINVGVALSTALLLLGDLERNAQYSEYENYALKLQHSVQKLNVPEDSPLRKDDAIPLPFPPAQPPSQDVDESESEDGDEEEDEALVRKSKDVAKSPLQNEQVLDLTQDEEGGEVNKYTADEKESADAILADKNLEDTLAEIDAEVTTDKVVFDDQEKLLRNYILLVNLFDSFLQFMVL